MLFIYDIDRLTVLLGCVLKEEEYKQREYSEEEKERTRELWYAAKVDWLCRL